MTPMQTTMKATSVPIDTSSPRMPIGSSPAKVAASTPVMAVETCGVETRVHRAEELRQQAVVRHRQPDARLRDDHGDDHRGQAEQRAEDDPGPAATAAADAASSAATTGAASLSCVNGTRPVITLDIRMYSSVQIAEAAEHADRHAARRILGLLRHGGDAIEADIGEEDDRRGLQDAAPAELAEGAGVLAGCREPSWRG